AEVALDAPEQLVPVDALGGLAGDGHHALLLQPRDAPEPAADGDVGHGDERDLRAFVEDGEAAERLEALAVLATEADGDVVLVLARAVRARLDPVDGGADGLRDLLRREAEARGALAVDADLELRAARVEVVLDVHEPRQRRPAALARLRGAALEPVLDLLRDPDDLAEIVAGDLDVDGGARRRAVLVLR